MTSKLSLFDQTLSVSLSQPGGLRQPEFKVRINLKITEHRNEVTGDKEIKFEISRRDDFEFLYAEVLNKQKYQKLAESHDLTVDFDSFTKVIIQHLLSKSVVANGEKSICGAVGMGSRPEITITLDEDRNSCAFELFSRTPISKGKIFSIKLMAVRGDHLIAHLLKICTSQAAKLNGFELVSEELVKVKKELCEAQKLLEEKSEIEQELNVLRDDFANMEADYVLAKEERENIRTIVDEKKEEVEQLQVENEELQIELEDTKEELEVVAKMLSEEQAKFDKLQKATANNHKDVSRLRQENSSLARKLEAAMSSMKQKDQLQSVDTAKLRELETDLKQKDGMVESLSQTNSAMRQDLENEKMKLKELQEDFERVKMELEKANITLNTYRNGKYLQTFSPASTATAITPSTTRTYRNVLGTTNSPYTPIHESSTFRFQTNSTTPHHFRNLAISGNDTTASSVTNTPPTVMIRNSD